MESKPPPQPLRFINYQALFAAVRSGDLQSVKTHLTDPASISALMSLQNEAGETLLYIAAEGNLVEVFGYLLGFCDVEVVKIRSRSDMNAFHVAVKLGHLGIVKQLLDAWPELCTICDLTNTSPLYTAAVKNHLDIVRAILDVDASTIHIVRKNGKTSLHTAARYGYLDMVKLLIDKDPGIICIKDKKGQTALHMAVKGHSAAVVEEMLLVDGTILNERDKKGNTAVHIATRKSRPQGFFSRFSRSTTMGSSKTIVDLPSDLLLPIFSRLDRKDLQSLSLVSKPFLELSNRFVRKLTFKTLPDDRSFREIFARFSSVNQINLRTKGVGVARTLTAISKSQLNLEALKIRDWPTYPEQISHSGKLNIKSLALGYFPEVKVDEVVDFIRLFPSLEELYFGGCYVWDDAGVESLAAMLPNLIKIDLSNNYYLTDRALYALSANCANLELICIDGCNKFTPQGLCTFLLRCRKLKYLDLPYFTKFPESNMLVAETVSACENVHHLSINFSLITDDTLGIIAKSRAPLTSLKMRSFILRPTIAYTMSGLSAMLCAFQGLTRLAIYLPLPESDKFLDKKMSKLVKSLPCLTGVSITSYCPIYATLFSLIENCPFMECIYLNMDLSYPDRCLKVPMPRLIKKNYTIKYIRLYPSPDVLFNIALASFCPCLKIWHGNFSSEFFFP